MKSTFSRALLLIAMVVTYLFLLVPLIVVIGASFDGAAQTYFRFPPQELSLRWYYELPARYWQSLGFSFIIAFIAAAISTLIGTLAALGIARGSLGGSASLETYFRFPLQVPFVVTGVVFLQFYYLLFDVIGINLLGTIWGFVIAHAFFCIPYSVGAVGSMVTPSLDQIEQAARIAGATERRVFQRITLPALMPGLFSGFFFGFIVSFGDVPVSVFLSAGGAVPLPVEIFQTLQFDYDPTTLAISSIVVVISSIFIVGTQRIVGLNIVLPSSKR
ncbi:ABC transporter permease [Chelativorans sp. YIM 93263]|uniref:ABC transporter permease n=1 Tax=Chelativorans sp. YIM 93263 TaxID=2906648 RepID=UPI002377F103|nr:ABC transporter permease subunit [Chelativorans sp. YIM 93263]